MKLRYQWTFNVYQDPTWCFLMNPEGYRAIHLRLNFQVNWKLSTLLPSLQTLPVGLLFPRCSLIITCTSYFSSSLLPQCLQVRAVVLSWRHVYLSPAPHLTSLWGTFGHVRRHCWLSQAGVEEEGYQYQVGRGTAAAKHPTVFRIAPPPHP